MIFIKRSVIIASDLDLVRKMKFFNDEKQFKKTLQLFDKHKEQNIETCSNSIIIQALKACTQLRDLKRGSLIHRLISSQIKNDSSIVFSLIQLYMQCGDVTNAQSLFDTIIKKSLSIYGIMMKGYIKNNMPNKAIELFHQIKKPDEIIIIFLFNAGAKLESTEALHLIKETLSQIPKSFFSNVRLVASALDALMKCGDILHAQSLFNKSKNKSLSMYGAMMKGYVKHNRPHEAIELFNQIKDPDEVIILLLFNAYGQIGSTEVLSLIKKKSLEIPQSFYSNDYLVASLLDALIKCDDLAYAQSLFNSSRCKTISMFGAMMSGFNKENNPFKTLSLFNEMKISGIKPNRIIYLCLIKALSQIGDYSLCKSFIEEIPNHFLIDNQCQTALIDMYGKSGCIDQAKQIFAKMSQLDHIGYTAMINSYGLNGMGTQAVELYHQMPLKSKNEVTHVCVLNACSHSGLVDEARSIFQNAQIKTLKIFTSMVDCLSRASFFEEAQKLIDEFEHNQQSVLPMYMALLSGVRNDKNSQLSQQIYDRMKQRFPEINNSLTPAMVLLANIYASSGEINKASDIKIQLAKSGAKKKVGLSWTVVLGQLYEFRAHDQTHPRSSEIYAEMEKISKELIEHGHQYDSSWVTRPLDHDETIASVLCGHSEKLAIAWNFVANPTTSRIQVTKNLRVCGDCHRATKLIAAIRQCEIVVRDANRIHHFYTNGKSFPIVDTETSLFNVGEDFQALVSIAVVSPYFFLQNTLYTCDLEKRAQTMNDYYSTTDPPSILYKSM
ncbi:unnamed protein product [Rotaria magnacalcarata]|uniref:DYW domain-containing protein n=1 Tax=Rotaria magnacalcarata TaxID=392030 RepID=A0A8S2PH85_9BILA|nr:unnamed protein product [Rotaria magnacalcarata]